jgi:hypothetical protein
MKGIIKKLAVFVMIAAIAMFIGVGMASADDHHWKYGIQGTYAVAGGGTGLLAFNGFNGAQIPVGASDLTGPYWSLSVVVEGILTLNRDGTGMKNDTVTVQTQPNTLLHPPVPPMMFLPWIGEQQLDSKITYTATKDGTIIIATDGPTIGVWKSGPLAGVSMPNAPASWRCRATPDQKALTCVRILSLGDAGYPQQIINTDFFVAIWQH